MAIIETVRIRDKSVQGGSRIVNREDVSSTDLIVEDVEQSDEQPAAKRSRSKTDEVAE